MTKEREWESTSLVAALTAVGIPAENHEFIQGFTSAIGIAEYRPVVRSDRSYVLAKRRDGGVPDLHIFYGYTTGFMSEDEILQAAGTGCECGASTSRKRTWYVAHPKNRVRS
jgi:hypothetical protein